MMLNVNVYEFLSSDLTCSEKYMLIMMEAGCCVLFELYVSMFPSIIELESRVRALQLYPINVHLISEVFRWPPLCYHRCAVTGDGNEGPQSFHNHREGPFSWIKHLLALSHF